MNALVPVAAAPAMSIPDVERVALAIAKGGLFGSKDPNAVLTLCLLAQAEGQHPAVVFRDYHIIQGRPAKKADAMLRDFISAGGKVEWHTLTDECADATFTHPSGQARIEWTIARAAAAGIANPMWKKYPRQMLRSRVISEGVRTVFPGATSGLYEMGEVEDIVAEQRRDNVEPHTPAIEHETPAERQQQQRERPAPLQGPIKTRAALRNACGEFVRELHACGDRDMLDAFLDSDDSRALIKQVKEEHPFFWEGDGADFLGLDGEIINAYARFDPANAG